MPRLADLANGGIPICEHANETAVSEERQLIRGDEWRQECGRSCGIARYAWEFVAGHDVSHKISRLSFAIMALD
jgi:hypothetical protein